MSDLTTITTPFGQLDRATQMALFEASLDGKSIEYSLTPDDFNEGKYLSWFPEMIYRVRPEPVTPDSINWDHVAPQWIAMARDENGTTWLYTTKPKTNEDNGWKGGGIAHVTTFASYIRGTCDWKDSLVLRPVQS